VRRPIGLFFVLVGVAIPVWLLGFHGAKYFNGILDLVFLVIALAIFLLGSGILGGRALLGSLALLVGLVGAFLALLPDREAVPSFRFGVLAISTVLIMAGLGLLAWLLVDHVGSRGDDTA
jgi:hypothetical protein